MKNEKTHDEARTTERRSIVPEGMTLENAISREGVSLGEKLCELDINRLEKSQTTKTTYLDEYKTNDTPE